jgi:DnaJ-class molecular chaperone
MTHTKTEKSKNWKARTYEWSVTGTDRMEKCPQCNGKGILVKKMFMSACTKCEATGKINVVTEHVK